MYFGVLFVRQNDWDRADPPLGISPLNAVFFPWPGVAFTPVSEL